MKEVKRYDAVHIRYEESNIRYGEGCEVEMVAGYDYNALMVERDELLAALERYLPFIPVTSATEGGAAKYSENVRAADSIRAIIAKCRGGV
jgi:hypothetical protein